MAATLVTVIQGAQLAFAAVEVAQQALAKAQAISNIVTEAQEANQVHFTAEQWARIVDIDDQARTRLESAIANAKI